MDQYRVAWKQIVLENKLQSITDDDILAIAYMRTAGQEISTRVKVLLHSVMYVMIVALCQGCLVR